MKRWSEVVATYCVQLGIVNEEQLPWFIYGIEKRAASVCIFPLFFLVALFWTNLWCATSLFLSFYLLRRRTSGYHTNSVSACLCISLLLESAFLGIVYPLLQGIQTVLVLSICAIIIFIFAPYNDSKMNFTNEEISACQTSARVNTCVLSFATIISYCAEWYEISKGLLIGIAMATFLLIIAYILEWRKKNE